MVKAKRRDLGMLLAAIAGLIAGALAIQTGEASWFDVVGITGTQARLFGWASIAFALVILWLYIRGNKPE
ncbi:MAG: hypothetical protein QOF24_2661 [Verrucomicrobiota bacterium]|jgi:hypothetical protein